MIGGKRKRELLLLGLLSILVFPLSEALTPSLYRHASSRRSSSSSSSSSNSRNAKTTTFRTTAVCGQPNDRKEEEEEESTVLSPAIIEPNRRRGVMVQVATITTALTAASCCTAMGIFPRPAAAVQERNEALCGTGFFTNIALYKCTEIGDISQDGKALPPSQAEEGAMQSLLGKMGMDDSAVFVDDEMQEGKNKPSTPKSKKSKD